MGAIEEVILCIHGILLFIQVKKHTSKAMLLNYFGYCAMF